MLVKDSVRNAPEAVPPVGRWCEEARMMQRCKLRDVDSGMTEMVGCRWFTVAKGLRR